jgi:hypothetical protein
MKKLVTLALAGICALAFASVTDAATVLRQDSVTTIKTSENITHNSNVYANTVTNTGSSKSWKVDYVYSNDISRNSVVMQNLINALKDPYKGLVEAVANETVATNLWNADITVGTLDSYTLNSMKKLGLGSTAQDWANNISEDMQYVINPNKWGSYTGNTQQVIAGTVDWTNAVDVAAKVIPGRDITNTVTNTDAALDTDAIAEQAEDREESIEETVSTQYNEIVSHLDSRSVTDVYYTIVDGQVVRHSDINVVYDSEKTAIYSKTVNKYVSPLVLDMTGNGVLQASNGQHMPGHPVVNNNIILADFYGDGFEIAMEWVGPQDGLLVAPKADGSVDMSCLFGTAGGYDNGYEKLSLYDTNKDRKVKGNELNGLSVWQDANGNGIADAGEVKTVQELGITEIAVTPNSKFVSSFTMNGNTNKMWDWWPNAIELVKVASK